jgi:tetratricopeptide (TPR) repeat protein
VLLAALLAAATLVTLSRGAWLGAAAGLVVGAMLAWRAHPGARAVRVGRAAAIGAAALVAVAVAAVATSRWGALLAARFAEFLHPSAGSAWSRMEIWRGAFAAWRARPWLGHGTDTFELVFPRYQPVGYWRAEWGGVPFHAHSIYLQTLATRGALGVAAGLFGIGALALAAVAAWRRAGSARDVVAALIAMLAALAVAGAFGALGVSGAVLAVFAAGTLASWAGPEPLEADPESAGPLRRAPSGRPGGAARPRGGRAARAGAGPGAPAAPRGRGPLLAGGALAVVSLLAAGVELRSKHLFQRGLDAVRQAGSPDRAAAAAVLEQGLAAARRAVAIDPRNDALECLRANVCLSLANVAPEPRAAVEEAEAASRRAIELEPRRALDHFTLAWALLQRARLGDSTAVARAEAAFARGLDLAPANGLAMMQMAQNELVLGRAQVSLEIALRLAALYPAEAGSHRAVGHAYLALGDSARAGKALRRALRANWRERVDNRERTRLLVESLK